MAFRLIIHKRESINSKQDTTVKRLRIIRQANRSGRLLQLPDDVPFAFVDVERFRDEEGYQDIVLEMSAIYQKHREVG